MLKRVCSSRSNFGAVNFAIPNALRASLRLENAGWRRGRPWVEFCLPFTQWAPRRPFFPAVCLLDSKVSWSLFFFSLSRFSVYTPRECTQITLNFHQRTEWPLRAGRTRADCWVMKIEWSSANCCLKNSPFFPAPLIVIIWPGSVYRTIVGQSREVFHHYSGGVGQFEF